MTIDPKYLSSMSYRCIGPTRGGRVVAVAGDPVNPAVFYFGACAGGIWKTDDGGQYWECVSDGQISSSSVGALQVAPSDPNVIYAGMGESTIRIDVTHGDGVYKSTDAGRTWTHCGLAHTRHIGEIRVHPENPDLVYVAALGHAFKDNDERGVYRSKDGGKSWEQVLFVSEGAGAVDLSMDMSNPRILYATFWQTRRKFWSIDSGGPDSGLWRSFDGGSTWENISQNKGMPKNKDGSWATLGKIGVAASPAQSGRVWAIIESEGETRGLYRSDNYGDKWEKVCDKGDLRWRPWYYMHVFAHPTEPDTCWVWNQQAHKSTDGGKTFTLFPSPHGDTHDFWIDPNNPDRMIGSDDGGAFVSMNGGKSWSTLYNQMTAQFYHIATDNRYPYYVYGTQQDNSSLAVPSRTHTGAIGWNNCYAAGTGESGFIAPHPDDHNIVFLGAIGSSPGGGAALQKYDHRTGQIQLVNVWPDSGTGAGKDDKYRFQWTFPIVFDPHNSDIMYACGNHVFKTENGGQSWDVISPDLTVADPATLDMSGGPITFDTAGAEMYATIFAFAASPQEQGVLWAGSDDGLIHVTKDGGQNWADVTPPDMAKFTQVTSIEHSPHAAGTVYVSAARHKEGDYAPYLYKTSDYGETWTLIVNGLPEDDFCRVIREDPNKQGLLYAGTELGVFFSLDDGATWQSLQNNLPVSPVYDLLVKENDLIVGTHGRSFWILDDVTPLHQLADLVASNKNFVVAPRDTVRVPKPFFADLFDNHVGKSYHISLGQNATFVAKKDDLGHISKNILDAGTDVAYGAVIHYYLDEKPAGEVKLEILDADGNVIRAYSSIRPEKEEERIDKTLKTEAGMNTLTWDMRHGFGERVKDQPMYGPVPGPLAPPGDYQVRLSLGDWSQTQPFKLVKDPRVQMTEAEFADQFAAMKGLFDKHSAAHSAVNKIRSASKQIDGWLERMKDHAEIESLTEMGKTVKEQLSGVEDELIQKHHKSFGDVLNHPTKLIERLGGLPAVIGGSDNVPTQQSLAVKAELSGLIDEQLGNLDEIFETNLAAFNNKLKALQTPAVYVG